MLGIGLGMPSLAETHWQFVSAKLCLDFSAVCFVACYLLWLTGKRQSYTAKIVWGAVTTLAKDKEATSGMTYKAFSVSNAAYLHLCAAGIASQVGSVPEQDLIPIKDLRELALADRTITPSKRAER